MRPGQADRPPGHGRRSSRHPFRRGSGCQTARRPNDIGHSTTWMRTSFKHTSPLPTGLWNWQAECRCTASQQWPTSVGHPSSCHGCGFRPTMAQPTDSLKQLQSLGGGPGTRPRQLNATRSSKRCGWKRGPDSERWTLGLPRAWPAGWVGAETPCGLGWREIPGTNIGLTMHERTHLMLGHTSKTMNRNSSSTS